jgi:hypothetical protein
MIDRAHDLPIGKQAEALNISRGSIYYLPRPVPAADLAIMRRLLSAAACTVPITCSRRDRTSATADTPLEMPGMAVYRIARDSWSHGRRPGLPSPAMGIASPQGEQIQRTGIWPCNLELRSLDVYRIGTWLRREVNGKARFHKWNLYIQHIAPKHGSRPGTSVLKASMKPPSTCVT